jgi:hypothetical protein
MEMSDAQQSKLKTQRDDELILRAVTQTSFVGGCGGTPTPVGCARPLAGAFEQLQTVKPCQLSTFPGLCRKVHERTERDLRRGGKTREAAARPAGPEHRMSSPAPCIFFQKVVHFTLQFG